MKSLFNDKEKMTPEAIALGNEICGALKPIISKYAKQYPAREIHLIANGSVYELILEIIIDKK